jgi:uncharacterized repeat protein (TIGR01451 family)
MSRSSTLKRWMPVLVLALLPVFHTMVAGAAPPAAPAAAPMLGFTPTVTVTPCKDDCCDPPCNGNGDKVCIPVITKRCDGAGEMPGDEVIFTIQVSNQGDEKAVDVKVRDTVPSYLKIEKVTVNPEDQCRGLKIDGQPVDVGTELTIDGQEVEVDLGTIGKDLGVVEIIIRTRMREGEPEREVENVARFKASNCSPREAVGVCPLPECELPECGGTTTPWWMVAGGLSVCVLVLGLALSRQERA